MKRRDRDEFFDLEKPDFEMAPNRRYLDDNGEDEDGYYEKGKTPRPSITGDDFDDYEEITDEPEDAYQLEVEKNKFKVYVRKSEQTAKTLKTVIGLLTVLLVILVAFIILIIVREHQTKSAFFAKANIVSVQKGEYKLTENLDKVIGEFSSDSFAASVTQIDNLEYLCFSSSIDGETVNIFYQNEFADEKSMTSGGQSYMEKNGEKIKISGEYDITKPEELVPYIIQLSDKGTGFLFIKKINGLPQTILSYSVTTFEPISSIDLGATFQYYFKLTIASEENKLIDVSEGGVTYRYKVSDDEFERIKTYAADEQKKALYTNNNISYEIANNVLTFRSFISLNDREYLGEYTGDLTFSSTAINMVNAKFAAYVGFDFEDEGSARIITPREDYLEERVIISGKDIGKYAFPIYDKLTLSTLDKSLFVKNEETGIITYSGDAKTQAGIDVSKFQGKVDWNKVKATGVTFAFVRGGYRGYTAGNIVADEYGVANLKGAKAAGINAGVYFFTQAITVDEAKKEAEFSAKVMKDAGYDKGIIVFDTEAYDTKEEARGNKISREERTKICKAFAEKVKALGYTPVIYFNTRWAYIGLDLNELSEYPMWYACYSNEMTLPYAFDIWQYSDKGVIAGVNGKADFNIMFKDVFK